MRPEPADRTQPNPLAGIGDEAHADLGEQLRALNDLGWPGIELRTIDGIALADLDDARFESVADAVAESGLDVVCLDSRIGNWGRSIATPMEPDLTELRVLADRAARLGCRYVRVMSYPRDETSADDARSQAHWRAEVLRRMRLLATIAHDSAIVLLHENCAGWAGTDPRRAVDLVATVDSPALRLLFDTGNGRAYGYDEVDYLAETVEFVEHVHVKDAVGTAANTRYVAPGHGECRVAESIGLLRAHGYRGYFSIEPHLSLRPHEQLTQIGDSSEFVSYGRDFERFLAEHAAAGTRA
ncbi:sugar phosphate isomerase/epimerase family protein [Nocardia cyriacigeorgica]|uniref:sugar phosphate isomerase/epimerase family protein n=1 Tax=Nocardia cyriacigeorgica TaxID=135487 RepID=UPI0018954EB9|nr:sugar phosphate isomerase/epimerase family protein [Nocardia cyriacigeorgica]MBF6436569.1 sugar phosphate isomerase/epimerase [Nocardia cyriacigeorgica]MBF6452138.1 sugar phosphate isomerase/epimerase [Nocardia cyriacigeorgica]MBF6478067.1 sugar phosphate isomerase/epimerase [Nocardia cyriacigeorgica]MBF6549307.1 sugar phosphate isomerase/epimerase [Nocardia cyriacigeorgica]